MPRRVYGFFYICDLVQRANITGLDLRFLPACLSISICLFVYILLGAISSDYHVC